MTSTADLKRSKDLHDSIVQKCQISLSQEEHLRHSAFVSEEDRRSSARTITLSSPATSHGGGVASHADVFQTPPDDVNLLESDSQQQLLTDHDGGDKDRASRASSSDPRIRAREILNRLNAMELESGTHVEEGNKNPKVSGTTKISSGIQGDDDSQEVQRIAEILVELNGCGMNSPANISEWEKSPPVEEKSFHGRPAKRALPVSLCGKNEDEDGGLEFRNVGLRKKNHGLIEILNVLQNLSEKDNPDPELENLSIYEIAKRRGYTFP